MLLKVQIKVISYEKFQKKFYKKLLSLKSAKKKCQKKVLILEEDKQRANKSSLKSSLKSANLKEC